MEFKRLAFDESQTGEAMRQCLKRELRLQFAQRRTQTIVDALAKAEGFGHVRAAQIKRLGLRKNGGIAAGRG